MKATKFFVSILQLFTAVFIVFQTYSAWSQIIATDASQRIVYGAFVLAGSYLVSGIINLVYHNSDSYVPEIIYFVIMVIGWFFARNNNSLYKFLNLWAWLALLLGLVFLIWHIVATVFFDSDSQKQSDQRRRGETDSASEMNQTATNNGSYETGYQNPYNNSNNAYGNPNQYGQQPNHYANSYNGNGANPYGNQYPQNTENRFGNPPTQTPAQAPTPSRAATRARKSRRSRH